MTPQKRQEWIALLQKNSSYPELKERTRFLFKEVPHNYDKLLFLDLCRLCVNVDELSLGVLAAMGRQTLGEHRDTSSAFAVLQPTLKAMAKNLFHENMFKPWRKGNEKEFLKKIRAEEKAKNQYAKPYIDYLDQEEHAQFQVFWDEAQWPIAVAFLTGKKRKTDNIPFIEEFIHWHKELEEGAHEGVVWREKYLFLKQAIAELDPVHLEAYLKSLRGYAGLSRSLYGSYSHLRHRPGELTEKDLASAFYPRYGFGFGRSQAFRQAAPQGSIFKLVVAYEGLMQNYDKQMDRYGRASI